MSVVIPTRDRPDDLARAVESVLGQRLRPLECIVVDDGSSPPASPPRDDLVRVIRVEASRGRSRARNLGVEAAAGELVAFLDDDDAWAPDHLESLMAAYERARRPVMVESGHEGWRDGDHVYTQLPRPDRPATAVYKEPRILPSAVAVRRDALLASGGFDTALHIHEDWDLWVRLGACTRAVVEHATVRRRLRADEITARERLRVHRSMAERLQPRLAALGRRERREVKRWMRRTTAVRLAHVAVAALVGEAGWARLRARRRHRSPGTQILRW